MPSPDPLTSGMLGDLAVLDPDTVAVDWIAPRRPGDPSALVTDRRFSDDGGRTWRTIPMSPEITDEVAAVPAGAELRPRCADSATRSLRSCPYPGIAVVRPDTGTAALLANGPALDQALPGAVPTAAGHWWAVGRVPGTPRWALSVSTDDGRTWTTGALAWQGAPSS